MVESAPNLRTEPEPAGTGTSYRAVLLFGAPGVGKGTQGKLLGAIPGLWHLATGDMFRSLDKSSELGREFVKYSSQGLLVPDELTIRLWQEYVKGLIDESRYRPTHDLLLLDGIPRSRTQAEAMDHHIDVLGVIHLSTPDVDAMVTRMKKRAAEQNRHDDADEDVIRRRFEVYEQETAPVLKHYEKKLIHEIAAVGTPVTVLCNILQVIAPIYDRQFGNPLK